MWETSFEFVLRDCIAHEMSEIQAVVGVPAEPLQISAAAHSDNNRINENHHKQRF
jgi:hypothetical protein